MEARRRQRTEPRTGVLAAVRTGYVDRTSASHDAISSSFSFLVTTDHRAHHVRLRVTELRVRPPAVHVARLHRLRVPQGPGGDAGREGGDGDGAFCG